MTLALIIKPDDFHSVPAALEALDRLEVEIRTAPTLEAVDAIADAAAGLQRRFRSVKDVADRAGEVWIAADVRLAAELAKMQRAICRAGPGRGKAGAIVGQAFGGPTLAELGVARKRAARAHRLHALPENTRKAFISELKAAGAAITPNALLIKDRMQAKQRRRQEIVAATFSADGPFGTVVIDPPWQVEKIDRDERPNQAAFDYPTMSADELLAFWRAEMAPRIEPDCHLFTWATEKYLPDAINFMALVGFRYVFTMVWTKPGGFQPLDLPQYNVEFIVYARRGSPLFVDTKDFRCGFDAPRREHSRKPDRFYDTIRRVTGGSRIDVFSREAREGFAQYGNEITKFDEAEAPP